MKLCAIGATSLLTLAAALSAQTLNPTADAYVQSGTNQNTPFGTSTFLDIKLSSVPTDDFNREAYLKFDLSSIGGIGNGKLRLYGSDQGTPETVVVEVRSSTDTSWSETAITWANKPAAGSTVHASLTVQGSNTWHEWDITSFLRAEKAAGRNVVSLVLRSNVASTTSFPRFHSKENVSNKAELLIVPDNTAPAVTLTAPTRNKNVSGTAVALTATATDPSGISIVDFFDNDFPVASDSSSPYSVNWNTTTVPNGVHLINAAATDAAGNIGASADVPVIVNNLPATYLANKRTGTITVDGNLSESEWSTSLTASKLVLGTAVNNTVTFGALWDSSYLYLAVRVLDANLYKETGNHWDDDSVEVYVDGNRNGPTNSAYQLTGGLNNSGFDRQFVKRYNDTALYSGVGQSTTGVLHGVANISGGYTVELAIPWTNVNLNPAAGLTIGFDVGNNDDDDGGPRDCQLVWNGSVNNYNNTSGFGALTLVEPNFPLVGAPQSWAYYEAEDAPNKVGTLVIGTKWGYDSNIGEHESVAVPFEARGKKAVVLAAQNDYVEWTNVIAPGGMPATHATVCYSIPESKTGTLALSVNGVWKVDLPLTYLRMREAKPELEVPGGTVRFYDDVMVAVPGGIPAGATVRLAKKPNDAIAYTVDFLEVETAPAALTKPDATWLDITASPYNAIPNDGLDDRAAIVACLAAANSGSKKVWLPAGTFDVMTNNNATSGSGIIVPVDVQIRGAGMWHTVLKKNYTGQSARLFTLSGGHLIQDFKVVGSWTTLANNGGNCVFLNTNANGTIIERIWTEYTPLFIGYNCTNGVFRYNRIRNTYKDAMHIARAAVNNLVEYNTIRNAGDDGVPFVSYGTSGLQNNTARYNTVECGHWGRGISNLGGDGNRIEFNLVRDWTAAGLLTGVEEYSGETTPHCKNWVVAHNLVIRCGNGRNGTYGGAVSLFAIETNNPMFGRMENNTILAPPFHGAQLKGNLGDAGVNTVYYRYNQVQAPTTTLPGYQRKVVVLEPTYLNTQCVHEPNSDL